MKEGGSALSMPRSSSQQESRRAAAYIIYRDYSLKSLGCCSVAASTTKRSAPHIVSSYSLIPRIIIIRRRSTSLFRVFLIFQYRTTHGVPVEAGAVATVFFLVFHTSHPSFFTLVFIARNETGVARRSPRGGIKERGIV